MNKIIPTFADAVADIPDGATLMIDGFAGPGGTPQNLIRALRDRGARRLTIISNTAGLASVIGFGTIPGDTPTDIGVLVENEQVEKVIASFPVSPSPSRPTAFERAYLEGKVGLEVVPQGTLAETHPSGRRGHSRVLHAHRRRNANGGGQGNPRVRRTGIPVGNRPHRRLRAA